uniref:RNA-directed DNA polymerase, eukaryota n=1 Tax=Tanacetum cinerariifolium TaxID=118510 RepID=A0A699JLR2_TANCI|nr:RNA-directed DNA polymerase, eukaryota [Tanacetum cinerariifolium]
MKRWIQNSDHPIFNKDTRGQNLTTLFSTRIPEDRILDVENSGEDTIWIKLVPKKVNIFVWKVLKRRLQVREELDKRGVLDMVLCPCCNSVVESGGAFSIRDMCSLNEGVNLPNRSRLLWQAVLGSSGDTDDVLYGPSQPTHTIMGLVADNGSRPRPPGPTGRGYRVPQDSLDTRTRILEDRILDVENAGEDTIWIKLVPKKVNIFVWKVWKRRLPVREELDKRGVLDTVLCPCCNSVVESCEHSRVMVMCSMAMDVWEKIHCW